MEHLADVETKNRSKGEWVQGLGYAHPMVKNTTPNQVNSQETACDQVYCVNLKI